MGAHLIDGEFQSDKYPTCPRGKVPLSVLDPTAHDLLWEYAQRRRAVDEEFSDDLETALRNAGHEPRHTGPIRVHQCARCGLNHDALVFREMARPMAPPEAAPLRWTHFALCPTFREPIMMMIVNENGSADAVPAVGAGHDAG